MKRQIVMLALFAFGSNVWACSFCSSSGKKGASSSQSTVKAEDKNEGTFGTLRMGGRAANSGPPVSFTESSKFFDSVGRSPASNSNWSSTEGM